MEREVELKDLLENEIETQIKKVSELKPGSNEHSAAVESLTKLYKLNIEETENERAFQERCDRDIMQEREYRLKVAQHEEQVKSRWANIATQVALAVGGWVAYDVWQRRGYKFEREGTISTPWLRNLVSKMTPKK